MGDTQRGTAAGVEAFIARARALDDAERQALAEARDALDEAFHAGAWRAATEILAGRAEDYHAAWVRIGPAFVPERLEELVRLGSEADRAELARWQRVARSARLALEDALLALLVADLIRPPDLRELYGPWQAMLGVAHERARGEQAS